MPDKNSTPSEIRMNITVASFANLFIGREDAWGEITGGCKHEHVTKKLYARHLAGEQSIGIFPLLDDGTTKLLVIDIDKEDFQSVFIIVEEFKRYGFRAFIERSKKKGFHAWIFFEEFVQARHVRHLARTILNKVNLPYSVEIFPKQDVLSKETPLGNYINLPYFRPDSERGRRVILNPQDLSQHLSLEEFVNL